MGYLGLEEPSPAKLARIAADQRRPEFQEWLASMDSELNTFFTEDLPGLPENPYTSEGLHQVEEFANADFHDRESKRNWWDLSNRIERYIGELLVRTLEGEWKYINVTGEGLIPVVQTPFRMSYFEPEVLLSGALGGESYAALTKIYERASASHAAWIEHGRLPLRDWVELQSEQRRGLR